MTYTEVKAYLNHYLLARIKILEGHWRDAGKEWSTGFVFCRKGGPTAGDLVWAILKVDDDISRRPMTLAEQAGTLGLPLPTERASS